MPGRPLTVFRASEAPVPPGPATPGMDRREIVQQDGTWIGWVQTDAGFAGGWHHHGDRDSFIYIISGDMTLEFGPGGGDSLVARPGDVVLVPPRTIHREITPGRSARAIVVRIGSGPQNVNVDGPED